jgi:GTPase SAR1 family protein
MKEKESPFTPGSPVPVDSFVGRQKQIKEILRYAKQVKSGRQENIFLTGERGIGKSSLASFLFHLLKEKEDFLTVYVSLGGVEKLDELVRRIFEKILSEINNQESLKNKVSKVFKYVEQVDLFGISLRFNPPKKDLDDLVRNFPEIVKSMVDKIKEEKSGIFIVLDDINGISKTTEFANWYKSFVDSAAIHYNNDFPIFMMPIGLPEIKDALNEKQPSLMRIFRVIEVEKLSNKEVKDFFESAFKKVEITVESKAMEGMVLFSSGLPILMQEIGDAVFWINDDDKIDQNDVTLGIFDAADRIGKKYLEPQVYRAIRSERYRSILRKLGEKITSSFRKKEIENSLNAEEKKVFNNFLRKMRDLGIIVQNIEEGRGSYRFVNELYPVYIWMESQNFRKKRT